MQPLGGIVKAAGLDDGPWHRQFAIAKLRRLRLTLPLANGSFAPPRRANVLVRPLNRASSHDSPRDVAIARRRAGTLALRRLFVRRSEFLPLAGDRDGVTALLICLDGRRTVVREIVDVRAETEVGGHRLVPGDNLAGMSGGAAHDIGEI